MTYDDFLIALSKAPHAVACAMCERQTYKSVREVCADFRAKFGVYL